MGQQWSRDALFEERSPERFEGRGKRGDESSPVSAPAEPISIGKRLLEVAKRVVCSCRAWILCFWPEDNTVVDEVVLPRSVRVVEGPLRKLVTVPEDDEVQEWKEEILDITDQPTNYDKGQGREGRYGQL